MEVTEEKHKGVVVQKFDDPPTIIGTINTKTN
jgi:hypothetical protein